MKRILVDLRNNENTQRNALCILINVIFASVFCFLNFNTGIFADDYGYLYCFSFEEKITAERVSNLTELFQSQYAHYHLMNGRAVAHTLLQFSLMLGKPFFNILNTFFYVALANGIYLLAKKPDSKHSPILITLAYLLPWLFYSKFAEVFLLACVSAGYHWMMVLVLYFILPFKKLFFGKDIFKNHVKTGFFIMLFFGVLAGWASENGSAAMLFLLGCLGLYMLIAKKRIPLWCYSGFAGALLGFFMMLNAPGYDIRMKAFEQKTDWLQRIKDLVFSHTMRYSSVMLLIFIAAILILLSAKLKKYDLVASAGVLIIHFLLPTKSSSLGTLFDFLCICLMAVLIGYLLYKRRSIAYRSIVAIMFFITALVANTAMIMTPLFQIRSEFPFLIFLCVCGLTVFEKALELTSRYKNVNLYIMIALLCFSIFSLTKTAIAAPKNYKHFLDREKNIEISKQNGDFDIVFEEIPTPDDFHLLSWTIWSDDPEYWVNKSICRYYGINSVIHEKK